MAETLGHIEQLESGAEELRKAGRGILGVLKIEQHRVNPETFEKTYAGHSVMTVNPDYTIENAAEEYTDDYRMWADIGREQTYTLLTPDEIQDEIDRIERTVQKLRQEQ
jgi:hypothetical protein